MPNWCHTTYVFHGPADDVNLLFSKIKTFTNDCLTDKSETGFGNRWLGNILVGVGLEHAVNSADPAQRLSCRGEITFINDSIGSSDTSFRLCTITAWIPMPQMWDVIIKKLNLNIEFTFQSVEPGCEVYCMYDPYGYNDFPGEIIIRSAAYEDDSVANLTGCYLEADALVAINKALKQNCKTIDDAIAVANEYNSKHINNPRIVSYDYVCVYRITKLDSYDAYINGYYTEGGDKT